MVREQAGQHLVSMGFKSSSFSLEEFFILSVLKGGEMYALQIERSLSSYSEFGLSLGRGVLYPTLKTLVSEGLLTSRLGSGSHGPVVYYSLSETGFERLKDIAYWLANLGETAKSLASGKPRSAQSSH